MIGYAYVAATVILTVYGQLVFKWLADDAGSFPSRAGARADYLLRLIANPWMITVGIATLAAAVTWFLALKHLELSHAYPFMSLSFVAVLLLSGPLFGEAVTFWKSVGVALIFAGVLLGSRA